MSEELITLPPDASKEEMWAALLPQVKALIEAESDQVARMANVAAAVHLTFGFWWTGFYRVDGNQLVLGPFQGPLACTRIPYGKGVCGTAWARGRTVVVDDVEQFPGHIACSSESRSEIVVPVKDTSGNVTAVIDIDSRHIATFNATDAAALEQIAGWLG